MRAFLVRLSPKLHDLYQGAGAALVTSGVFVLLGVGPALMTAGVLALAFGVILERN